MCRVRGGCVPIRRCEYIGGQVVHVLVWEPFMVENVSWWWRRREGAGVSEGLVVSKGTMCRVSRGYVLGGGLKRLGRGGVASSRGETRRDIIAKGPGHLGEWTEENVQFFHVPRLG